MNNRIVGEFEERASGHKKLRGSQGLLDSADSRHEEETLLQAAYQRAIAVGRKRVFSGQGKRRDGARRGGEQPSTVSKMEPTKAYNNRDLADETEGMGRLSARDRVAGGHGSSTRDIGAETAGKGGSNAQGVCANDLKYQLDLDEVKQGRNSQFENRYIQRKHTGASVIYSSQTERTGEVGQSELGAHRLADGGSRADASWRLLKEEERQGPGEVAQRETDECGDLIQEKDGASRSTGSGPKHHNKSQSSVIRVEDLPRQDHQAPIERSRRPSTRFGAESAGYFEPTIEKAVQCIQILPPERPKPQYVYITDHQGRLIEIEQGRLDSLRARTPATATKRAVKSGTARADSHDDRRADDEDDHSQNETKSQITQFTDNTGTNNPSQQFQMNQVRAFQNMNAELQSQPSPPAGNTVQIAEEAGSIQQKNMITTYQNQHSEQSVAQATTSGVATGANESQEQLNLQNAEEAYESRAMPLENHLKKLKTSTATAAGRSRLAANKLSELIDADQEAQEENTKAAAATNQQPLITFNNHVFDIVAKKEAREKQRTTSFTQSVKSCEMQSSGLFQATIASRLKKQPMHQGTVPSSGVTRSKKGTDLINVERFGVLANTRPKSSQIGRGGTTGQPRGKMAGVQRNNMKSTREDSATGLQARGSLLRSANQLSSAGASHDPAVDSATGSGLPRKRREQALAAISGGNPRKTGAPYNQSAQPHASRKLVQAQSPAEAPYAPVEQAETRIRAAYKEQYGHFADRSNSRKVHQDGPGDNLANPSIIPQEQARRASLTRLQSQIAGGKETDDDNSNYGTTEKPQQDSKRATMTEEDMKKEMVAAFQKIRLDVYSDILRIKKPQTQAFVAAQLLCRLVCAFRGGAQRQVTDTKFPDWNQIQEFVHKKPNVIKFNQEITQLIQHMILSKDYLMQVKSEQLKNHLSKMSKIQVQYFAEKTKTQVLRQFQTNKNFSTIVNLCYCIVRYVLFQAGKSHLLNLTAEPTPYGSQSSASSLRRAEAGSEGERASSLNSGHSAAARSSSKPALSSKNSVTGSHLNRAGSGRILGTRGKNHVAAQSRNGHTAFTASAEAHSTGATAPSGSYQQPGRTVGRKRSPRLPQKDLFQATINRLSTPKQHLGASKSQTAGASTVPAAQAASQKSVEQPRKRVAYMRPQEYEDEVQRKLYQATMDHLGAGNAGGSQWAPGAGRQTVKNRPAAQPQRTQLSRSQRPAGGVGRDKYSTAGRKKVNEPPQGSQQARTPAKGEDRTRVSKSRPYLEQVSRSYLQRRASPHEAYQQPKEPQPANLKANYHSRGDDLTSISVQNSWVQLVTGQAQSDLAASHGHLAASASKQTTFQHQRLQADCTGLQASTPNEQDSDARGSSPQFSQKKSRKLYEILLQQQRRKSNSKYEKLTLSSVSKKKKGSGPSTEFSGRKGTVPLVQTFAATSSTPGLVSTLYNSNVFSTQKSKQGKENHMVAKMDEQNSAGKALAATLAGRARADTTTKEQGRSLLSPHQSKAVAQKSFLLHRPSSSSIRSPKAHLHSRSKRGQTAGAASMTMNHTLPIQANNQPEINNDPPASEQATVLPESEVAEPPVPSSQHKTRKTRLERSMSKSGNRRDRHHRRRAAGDIQEGNQNKQDTPERERNFPNEYFNNAEGGARDEQLRQFLEIENKCGSFHNGMSEPKGIMGTEMSDSRPSQRMSAINTQREDMLQSGSPKRMLLSGQDEKISAASPQLGGVEQQNPLQDPAGEDNYQVRHVSVVEHKDLTRIDSPQGVEQQDDSAMSHMSSILQQVQLEAPHPAAQPTQPEHHSSFAPQDDLADNGPLEEAPEEPRRHTDTSIFAEEQAKEASPIARQSQSPSCNVPDGKSPLNFKRECKDSDDLSVLSGVGAGPAVVPQSTSRESGRISELPESHSTQSGEAKKEELGLDSESLLSEDHNYLSATKPMMHPRARPSPAVHEYKTTERSNKAADSPGSSRVDGCEAYDPFEEAKRIAAMIKAECLGQMLQEEKIVLNSKADLDDSTQERVPSRHRCSPPNELSARHLLQKERLRSGEGAPQREDAIQHRVSQTETIHEGKESHSSEQRKSVQQPITTFGEQMNSQRLHEQSRSDSTWTADTPYRPALAHPRRNSVLSSSGRRTPDTSRHELQVQTHFVQSSSQRRPYGNEDTNIVKRESCIGSHLPSEPPTAGQHFQTFLQYCDQAQAATGHQTAKEPADLSHRLSSQDNTPHRSHYQYLRQRNSELETPSCARVKVDEVIGRHGEVQRVEIGEDAVVAVGSERVVEEEGEATGSKESGGESQMSEDDQEERQTEQDMETQREKVRRDDVESESGSKEDAAYKSKSAGSSNEDGFYMQEIVSPFRQLRLSALGSASAAGQCEPDSPEYNKAIESTKWLINPIQVRRHQDADVKRSYFDVDDDDQHDRQMVSGRSSSPDSYQICSAQKASNPYWHPDLAESALNLVRRVSSPVISPGKLKAQVSQSRVGIMEQIMAKQLEIEENSPSRAEGHVNREMIQKLKERRLLQRSKSRDGPSGPIPDDRHSGPAKDAELGAAASTKDTHDLIRDIQQRLLSRQSQQ